MRTRCLRNVEYHASIAEDAETCREKLLACLELLSKVIEMQE
jgi:hypothetical protein